jgi:hypothetical protein
VPKISHRFESHKHRSRKNSHRRNQSTIDAAITVATYSDACGVAVAIYSRRRLLAQDFRLLDPGEVSTPERAWLRGYALACEWVADHRPGARVLIVEPQERRRSAAA